VESCPNCSFLVRDGATTCGVCGRPVQFAGTNGTPGPSATVRAARVGPTGPRSTPVAAVALLALIVAFGAAAGWAVLAWP
jgi:hypothetical protein